ncbi:aspartate/glutamate racemase family protein [Acidocella sp.]|uniref:aspartate/glutamate racemase family protein n=1 Tax=Acidocella sp. TaxID=50710 RepID=UPI003D050A38
MNRSILVINPNANQDVTDGLRRALASFSLPGRLAIECLTLAEGPFGIETQSDVERVAMPLAGLVRGRADADAFVIACYSDPGIDVCRSVTSKPVFGIQESGILTAMTRGERVGVIALSDASVPRHRRYVRRMGVESRVAGECAINRSVDESASAEDMLVVLTKAGRCLMADGADVIVLGCAGMARHRAGVEAALGIPVIDPVQAAVAMALGAVLAAMTGAVE